VIGFPGFADGNPAEKNGFGVSCNWCYYSHSKCLRHIYL